MKKPEELPLKYRVDNGPWGEGHGCNGLFRIPVFGRDLAVISSDGLGWEHVSVSLPKRCPTWKEMCAIKDMFWDEDEIVIQYHPAKKDYVNCHPNCLHMWKPVDVELPVPDPILVGPKGGVNARS